MSGRWLLLSLSLVGALGGCDLPVGSNEESEGLKALQAAPEKADAARFTLADTLRNPAHWCDRTPQSSYRTVNHPAFPSGVSQAAW